MARKNTPAKSPAKKIAPKPVAKTPVRNSAIPKVAKSSAVAPAPKIVTHDMIAIRAFEISCGPNCSSEQDNWYRAERELRGL
jgi:hypothetical protein